MSLLKADWPGDSAMMRPKSRTESVSVMTSEEAGFSSELEEGPKENQLPLKAAQVFSHTHTDAFWDTEAEKRPFLGTNTELQDYNQDGRQYEWAEDTRANKCGCGPNRDVLKVGVSLMTSLLLFPFLVWGGFVFLPFDSPVLDSPALRLVYTLRCSVFATVPIILGWLVLGVSRLRSGLVRPLFDEEGKEEEIRQVSVHRSFVLDSVSLFLLYFLNLVVMAMYLSQDQLKIIPLMTVVFVLGRLVYWIASVFNSSVRGFGFGLSFLPTVVMAIANVYFIFTVESSASIFAVTSSHHETPPPSPGKQRFWG